MTTLNRPLALFADRGSAGRQLAKRLRGLNLADPVVYALPRGGVPVAVEIAKALGAPLDLILVRKIGAPGQPELALGAVVDGEDAQTVVNEAVARMTGADAAYLDKVRDQELAEIERRRSLYLGDRAPVSAAGRTAIVVDDGLATGATAKAALRALKRRGAAMTVLAVPVGPATPWPKCAPRRIWWSASRSPRPSTAWAPSTRTFISSTTPRPWRCCGRPSRRRPAKSPRSRGAKSVCRPWA